MKISHKELAACQKSPKFWLASRIEQSSSGGGPRFGYSQALSLSLCELHKGGDLSIAKKQLEGYLERFKNEKKKDLMRVRLLDYAAWLDTSGIVPVDSNVILTFPASGEWHLGGYVSRVDILANGYRAVLFEPIVPNWKNELRMPLIQLAIAERYGRPAKEIRVGFHDLDGNEMSDYRYGETSREKAWKTFDKLGETISKLLPPAK